MSKMKRTLVAFLCSILLLTAIQSTAHAEFMDVPTSHKNYDAINYLQENSIVEGYEDGTYKPWKSVNRAEFLKIIIEGSFIETGNSPKTPFIDINHNSWYAPYLEKAYQEEWIQGYSDGTFRPEQTINKVEALKILGEVQNWQLADNVSSRPFEDTPLNAWYLPYVDYAKTKNFLEEQGSQFHPGAKMTRANISEIIYRSLQTTPTETKEEDEEEVVTEEETEETPEEPVEEDLPQNLDFEPVTIKLIPNSFYEGFVLNDHLPNRFYQNEVYYVEGEAKSSDTNKATIILDGKSNSEYQTFTGTVENKQFSIPIHFREPGNYNLGIITGENGSSNAAPISVLPELPSPSFDNSPPQKAKSPTISFENDQTWVSFDAAPETLSKISFVQNGRKIIYLNRQGKEKIAINYEDFKNFQEGKVEYQVDSAVMKSEAPLHISSNFVRGDIRDFQATEHHFSNIDDELIDFNPPETKSTAKAFQINGTTKSDTKLAAYVIKPNGFVDSLELESDAQAVSYFGSKILTAGKSFAFKYSPESEGTYILEINDNDGKPIVNHPIYIGNQIPLLPDFFDLNERKFFKDTVKLSSMRREMLEMINKDRADHGLDPIELADDLNDLAQAHVEDMIENNYFSHYNLDGESPEDRRRAAGIPTSVGENIAQDTSLDYAQAGLMRSAAHRNNILDPEWSRVGIGIVAHNGHLRIAQEFSTDTLDAEDLQNYTAELLEGIENLRIENNRTPLVNNQNLNLSAKYLNDKVIKEEAVITNSLFEEALEVNNVNGSSQAIGRIFNSWSAILESLLGEEALLTQSKWDHIGIDIQLDEFGEIHTLLIVNSSN